MSVETKNIRPLPDTDTKFDNPVFDKNEDGYDVKLGENDVEKNNKEEMELWNRKKNYQTFGSSDSEDGYPSLDADYDHSNSGPPDYDSEEYNGCQRWLLQTQDSCYGCFKRHQKVIRTALCILLALAYFAYFGYAMYYHFGDEGSWRLLGYTVLAILIFVISTLSTVYNEQIDDWWKSTKEFRESKSMHNFSTFIKWFLRVGVLIAIAVYVVVDIAIDNPENLISVAGLLLYIIIFYLTSVNPAKVNWHTVFWGIALQYIFALLILRTTWGYEMFKWLGDRVTAFLEYTTAGVEFVFGKDTYMQHFFAFKVLSIVVFFFTVINILYYLGVMQAIIRVLGRFLAFCMGTTPAESINAAANIFVSMTESPLMIRPFLKDMTKSELHAVMTGGFATIAGSVLGAYICFGIPANHLLSASVMSAPAALAISKLSYPEIETSKGSSKDFSKLEKTSEHNLIEAASNGATASIKIVGAIAVNVIAFLSLLAFLNSSITWFGNRAGVENLTFEFICSYALYPVSYFMGVETGDCRPVAELIGVKTFTNEFIAFDKLKGLIQNRKAHENYTEFYNTTDWYWENDDVVLNITGQVLKGGFLKVKSEVIATYALCGFANFGSIGITLGGLGTLAPTRKSDLSRMVLRAMICGNVACFLTACIAGLLYNSDARDFATNDPC